MSVRRTNILEWPFKATAYREGRCYQVINATHVRFWRKADIGLLVAECPLLAQSGHHYASRFVGHSQLPSAS